MMPIRIPPKILFQVCALTFLLIASGSSQATTITGTGFAVTADGVLITNYHVVKDCTSEIKAFAEGNSNTYYSTKSVGFDASIDLAALKFEHRVENSFRGPIGAIAPVTFRRGPALQQGEKVITYGFPLSGLLARNGNLTVGYVSALRGLGDDAKYIQLTAPVQAGNSGGPVLDGAGLVIGVVVAKLNALKVMLATGDVPQNVNFAVELDLVKGFLRRLDLSIFEADSKDELPATEIGREVKFSTYRVECESSPAGRTVRPLFSGRDIGPDDWVIVPPKQSPKKLAPSPRFVEVDVSKLKLSDIQRTYPAYTGYHQEQFQIILSNVGTLRVRWVTIGFMRTKAECTSTELGDYDGVKTFQTELAPGDSATLRGGFSKDARSFCVVRAVAVGEGNIDTSARKQPGRKQVP